MNTAYIIIIISYFHDNSSLVITSLVYYLLCKSEWVLFSFLLNDKIIVQHLHQIFDRTHVDCLSTSVCNFFSSDPRLAVIFATDTKNNIHQFLNNFSYVNLKIDWAQRKSKLFKSRISLIWGTIVALSILVYFRIKLNFDCKNVSLQTRLFPMNREIMSSQI